MSLTLTKPVHEMSNLELNAHIEELHDMLDDALTEQSVRNHSDPDMSDDYDDGLSDVEADAMTLSSAGWGTDEDYGYYPEDYY